MAVYRQSEFSCYFLRRTLTFTYKTTGDVISTWYYMKIQYICLLFKYLLNCYRWKWAKMKMNLSLLDVPIVNFGAIKPRSHRTRDLRDHIWPLYAYYLTWRRRASTRSVLTALLALYYKNECLWITKSAEFRRFRDEASKKLSILPI